MNSTTKICLNCGHECHGAFCSNCGQPTSISEKIDHSTFFKTVGKSMARMTPGFWNTLVGLTIRPWVVIHEYIHGKRVKYSGPVTMLILIMLYASFIYTTLDFIIGIDFLSPDVEGGANVTLTVADADGFETEMNWANCVRTYPLLFRLVLCCAAAFTCFVIYRNQGGRHHNFYEFVIAAIYMGCTFMIYRNILRPLDYFSADLSSSISLILYLVIGVVSLIKAFKIRPWWKSVGMLMLFFLLNIVLVLVIAIILAFAIYGFSDIFD